ITLYKVIGGACPVKNSAGTCAGQSSTWETNAGAADDNAYNGVEFTGSKRMTRNWQLLTGLTIQRYRGNFAGGDYNDPNANINRANSYLSNDSTYIFKFEGTYQTGHWGGNLLVATNYQHYTGYPLRPTASFGSSQGTFCSGTVTYPCNPMAGGQSETVALTPPGTVRLPGVNLLDFRFSRPTRVNERFTLEPTLDLFNVLNAQTITTESASVPQPSSSTPAPKTTTYLKPSALLNPFIAQIGLKLTF
ncbi:MAG: hypothetical protein ACRD1L_04160, partial [Terriglobales bacterium]